MERYQKKQILKDLSAKMVFLVGPRQVGKTWLAKQIAETYSHPLYLNYDDLDNRKIIEQRSWLSTVNLIVFDELHKMKEWKSYLKGVWDTRNENMKIIITGSARLDFMKTAGDALSGRFFTHRLLPFSVKEIGAHPYPSAVDRLMIRGGFPEPFLADDEVFHARWRQNYVDGLIRQDILDFERVHAFRSMQTLVQLLRKRVGTPVSYASLARDLALSPVTVARYIEILEALYIVFRVTPHHRNVGRSLLKEPKIYFFDTGLVTAGEGEQFENMVAVSLLKAVYGRNDCLGEQCSLRYLRTKDGKEVDFAVVRDDEPELYVEAKVTDASTHRGLSSFCELHRVPGVQAVADLRNERTEGRVEIRKAESWLGELFM